MIKRIETMLAKAGIELWSIEQRSEETAELFFIRRRLDMRRMKQTCKYEVTVFCDFEKDGKAMRGSSRVEIVPSQSDEEILSTVKGAYFAASFVANPTYEFPARQTCEPMEVPSTLSGYTVEQSAMELAKAIFAGDCDERAFLNSVEVFSEKTAVHLVMSTGTDVSYTYYGINGEFVAQCKEPQDVEMHHAFDYSDLDCAAVTAKVKNMLKRVADRAVAEQNLPTGTYDLILDGEQVQELLGYYAERTHAAMIYPGYSTWKVGTDVQGEVKGGEALELTLRAKVPYSEEGIPMTDRPLIRKGKMMLCHGGARLSSYLGVEPTGNYRAFSCENGSVDFDELRKTPHLYAVSFSDFQMDSMSGHFGGEIRLAYYFDGKTTRIVTGGSVNGSILDSGGALVFSKQRYERADYKGPFAVRIPGVKVAGTAAGKE
ncbi:MAG: metallopeptidase TldD-related protein [Oscillospiraceae bacterium]|nr:metallopeptidase TldD-related protein [Oscillospiraceae bacterium]